MVFQIATVLCILASAFAAPGNIGYSAPAAVVSAPAAVYSAPAAVYSAPAAVVASGVNSREVYRSQIDGASYVSGYSVSDSLTGDHKASHEENNHGAVVGAHSQLDPNGYERRTDYVADAFGNRQVITGSENGLYVNTPFYAIRPHSAAVVAAAPAVAYAAPVAAAHVGYAAPAVAAAHVGYAAPALAAAHVGYAAPAVAAAHFGYAAPALGAVHKVHY